jgi:indole-3-glycerol phosphate synthase
MNPKNILDEILAYTRHKVDCDKRTRPLDELQRMQADAPSPRPFGTALRASSLGVIAEIKRRSPSMGAMRRTNVEEAPEVYEAHRLVRAVSVLTNDRHFAMSIEEMRRLRGRISKPILRKDFIIDAYQVHEARAFGADAVLLMANVLSQKELKDLWLLCKQLGMDALFESHTKQEIRNLPKDANVCGINSRKLDSAYTLGVSWRYLASRVLSRVGIGSAKVDTKLEKFELFKYLPRDVVKVAESGVSERNIAQVSHQGWDCALIGTSLLMNPNGVASALESLDRALHVTYSSEAIQAAPQTA